LGERARTRESDLRVGEGLPQHEPRRGSGVVNQGEPTPRRAAAVREAGRRSTDSHPLRAATREAEGVVADRNQSAPPRAAGEDPWAEGGWEGGGSPPVGADLVGVEETGVGGQSAGDLLEEIGGEGRPAAGSHKERDFLLR